MGLHYDKLAKVSGKLNKFILHTVMLHTGYSAQNKHSYVPENKKTFVLAYFHRTKTHTSKHAYYMFGFVTVRSAVFAYYEYNWSIKNYHVTLICLRKII